jgi:hypothetical protein
MVSKAVQEAVGGLVIQTAWLELLAAQLVVLAGDAKDEWALLEPQQEVFKRARTSAKKMRDPETQQKTVNWLNRAQELQRQRHQVVHSIVHYDGRPGWSGFHPRSRTLRRMKTREIGELAEQARQHAELGLYRNVVEWPPALGVATEGIEPDDLRID